MVAFILCIDFDRLIVTGYYCFVRSYPKTDALYVFYVCIWNSIHNCEFANCKYIFFKYRIHSHKIYCVSSREYRWVCDVADPNHPDRQLRPCVINETVSHVSCVERLQPDIYQVKITGRGYVRSFIRMSQFGA